MKRYALVPILLGFFAMGFADIVGTVLNQVTAECRLSANVAGFLPSMIFIWFLLVSVPAGLLSARFGKFWGQAPVEVLILIEKQRVSRTEAKSGFAMGSAEWLDVSAKSALKFALRKWDRNRTVCMRFAHA